MFEQFTMVGSPPSLRSAIWTSVPGSAPKGVDLWVELDKAVKQGDARGVRLARAIQIQALYGAGNTKD